MFKENILYRSRYEFTQLKLLGFWSNDYIEKYAKDSEINNILINSKMNGVKIACICSLSNKTVLRKRVISRLMLHLVATMIIEKLVLMIK